MKERKRKPNYFNELKKKINEKFGNKVNVLMPNIEVKGTRRNTVDLVKYTQKYVNHSSKVYGQVWVVFDKDDYSDEQFNKAVENCDYNACWSNPNFELWLLSHLKKVTKYVSKDNILDELNKEFQRNGLGEYNKNDADIFKKITKDGKIHCVIKNYEYMENLNEDGQLSERNPMTKVYKIVSELTEYLD
ncbi:TPA: RloB domain-containing protein [Candidatus Ventrenecus stercoripullorum]|nr:RloB domain-containing protein [Candidatus Ventrenecus stercoripullorum]